MAKEDYKKPKRPKAPAPTELRFWIDAYSPSTIPMARLAEYMAQLAVMLGEPTAVHFVKLERGSTSIVAKVQHEAAPKVKERVRAVRRGEAPRDALRAYEVVNKMLRDDNGIGALKEESNAVIIPFPGRESEEEKYTSIRERGTIDGEIIRVGGPHKWVPILIQTDGVAVSGCWADRVMAKQLALRLFEPVRLIGSGKWDRNADGKWHLKEFIVENFEPLSDEPLSEAIGRLRAINAFKDTKQEDLDYLRHGPPDKQNGRH